MTSIQISFASPEAAAAAAATAAAGGGGAPKPSGTGNLVSMGSPALATTTPMTDAERRAAIQMQSDVLQPTFAKLPPDVREWRSEHVDQWFAELGGWLAIHAERWRREAMLSTGTQLLQLNPTESTLTALGITHEVQREQFRNSIQQLIMHQNTRRTAVVTQEQSVGAKQQQLYIAFCERRQTEIIPLRPMEESVATDLKKWSKLEVFRQLQQWGVDQLSAPILHALTLLDINGAELEMFKNWRVAMARHAEEECMVELKATPPAARWTSNVEKVVQTLIRRLEQQAMAARQKATEAARLEAQRNLAFLNISIRPEDVKHEQSLGRGGGNNLTFTHNTRDDQDILL